jgi:hypothetical protein
MFALVANCGDPRFLTMMDSALPTLSSHKGPRSLTFRELLEGPESQRDDEHGATIPLLMCSILTRLAEMMTTVQSRRHTKLPRQRFTRRVMNGTASAESVEGVSDSRGWFSNGEVPSKWREF